MIKFFLKFFILLLTTLILIAIYLTYFGIETDKFDELIKNKANGVNKSIKLDFNKTKIHLNPAELNIFVKLLDSKILIKGNKINLSKLNLFLSLKSFFTSDFLLERAEIAFQDNDIKDLTKITNIFLPKFINKQLNKVFEKGSLEGEFIIPFERNGKISKDYGFSGKIKKATINLKEGFSVKNLTTEINYEKDKEKNGFTAIFKKASFLNLDLSDTVINLKNQNEFKKVKILLHTNGKVSFLNFKKISSLLNLNIKSLKEIKGSIDLKTNIIFDINKKLKVKNLSYESKGIIKKIDFTTSKINKVNFFFPSYSAKASLVDANINLIKNFNDNFYDLKLKGDLCFLNNSCQNININNIYYPKNKKNKISGIINLENKEVIISNLNYKKIKKNDALIDFKAEFVINNYYLIKKFYFEEKIKKNAASIRLNQIRLNGKFEITDFISNDLKNIVVKTYSYSDKILVLNNNFYIKKNKIIDVSGKVFDAQDLLKSLYKKTGRKTFSENFTSNIKINFEKAITGTNDDISNFSMVGLIKNGSYIKLSLKGNFSKDEIVEMSIYHDVNNTKTLQVISDRARPFIENFDFVEGFQDGKLLYESIISKGESNSNILITDFKVSKVPALAQLLTLASLQGIADTLSGEGIRFDSFEMKSNTQGNVLNIEDALAMGPAVSILLEGYVDKGKVVSLRGTLVPATKLNSIIAKIPLVGNILVGKKTGEGVVGVSFKMKGPPKNIKTTVNPIKTLTPRFIVRALEKIKKKKKEETK